MARIRIGSRTVAVVAAIALGAVATFALTNWVRGIEARALEDVALVEAFVAKEAIPVGTPGSAAISAGLIDRTEIPRRTLPPGAVTRLDQISDRVAGATVYPGEILIRARFVQELGTEVQRLLEIPEGMMAMALDIGIPPGVAGFIKPGSRISVLVHTSSPDPGLAAPPEEDPEAEEGVAPTPLTGPSVTRTRFLLHDVKVLQVGRRVTVTRDGRSQDSVERSDSNVLMTLAVTPSQAERLAFANFVGTLWFTLLPDDAEEDYTVQTPGRTIDTLFS